jgi:glutamine phosphoribosylpyrophosphate amidotransferase
LVTRGKTLSQGIEGVYDKIRGSASILLLQKDGICAARDRFALSTRSTEELAARKAILAIEERHFEDVREYIDRRSKKYQEMVNWIGKELGVTTLKYQEIENMVEAIGLPREKLCLYCWIGNYSIK